MVAERASDNPPAAPTVHLTTTETNEKPKTAGTETVVVVVAISTAGVGSFTREELSSC